MARVSDDGLRGRTEGAREIRDTFQLGWLRTIHRIGRDSWPKFVPQSTDWAKINVNTRPVRNMRVVSPLSVFSPSRPHFSTHFVHTIRWALGSHSGAMSLLDARVPTNLAKVVDDARIMSCKQESNLISSAQIGAQAFSGLPDASLRNAWRLGRASVSEIHVKTR